MNLSVSLLLSGKERRDVGEWFCSILLAVSSLLKFIIFEKIFEYLKAWLNMSLIWQH